MINYGNKAQGVKKKLKKKKKTRYRNIKENLQKYYKNIDAYYRAERLLTAKPTEGTGFQTRWHPYKMTKDGKYRKLTIICITVSRKTQTSGKRSGGSAF